MRVDLVCAQETVPVDLLDGRITIGGSALDDIFLEGLPHGLMTLHLEADRFTVTSLRSVRVGETLFPARVPRLLLEGEELKLPNGVTLKRVGDPQRRDSRAQMATAFVAKELLEGGALQPQQTRAATLTCVTGLDRGAVFVVPFDDNIVGRGEGATIALKDRSVSRQHARLVRRGRELVLQVITTSMNGIYVNGLLLKKEQVLKTGDVIEVGQSILRFDAPERAPEERTSVVAAPAQPVPLPMVAEPARGLVVPWWETIPPSWWLAGGGSLLGVTVLAAALLVR